MRFLYGSALFKFMGMIITFCGHSNFFKSKEFEKTLLEFLENKVGNNEVDFYLGGYGDFDSFAFDCCRNFQKTHSNATLIYISPYLNNSIEVRNYFYDYSIYPEIEDKPPKYAIIYRNRWMVEKADLVVAYVKYSFGGAYKTYKYAKKLNKEIFNLTTLKNE